MSYFSGCHLHHHLVMLLLLIFCNSLFVLGRSQPLFYSSSREEMVQMAGYGEEKLSTVLITGSLNCQARFHNHVWPIPGASVAVNCHSNAQERKEGSKSMVARGITDEFGDFMVDLPSYLHAIPNLEKICTVKVDGIPKGSLCRPTHRTHKKRLIKLSSVGNGIRTYDAGNIRIRHSTLVHTPSGKDGGKE